MDHIPRASRARRMGRDPTAATRALTDAARRPREAPKNLGGGTAGR